MKKSLLSAAAIAVLGLLLSSFAFAQDDKQDKMVSAVSGMYVISAKAGGVNYVEGKVAIARKDGKSGLLLKNDNIEIGDKVTTGADGKAEILLNPGSFVRLGGNADFEFQSTSLDNLKLKLSAGSAIFEVYADSEFKVTLDLPDADIELTKSGVYRIDVLADGSGRLSVWKGKVAFGDQEIKAGKSAVIKGKNALTIAKFDRDNRDALDIWSQDRAKEAAAINKRLQRNALANSLLGSYNRGGWNLYNTFGLWVFDPFTGRWCFLPFGQGWSSPYGYGYWFNIYNCPLPPVVYTPPPTQTPSTPTTGQMTPEQVQIREDRRATMHTPTFQRFENNNRNEVRGGGGGSRDNDNNGGGWNNNRSRSDSNDSRSNDSRSNDTRSNDTRSNDTRPTFTPSMPTYTPPTPAPSTSVPDPAPNTRTKDN